LKLLADFSRDILNLLMFRLYVSDSTMLHVWMVNDHWL